MEHISPSHPYASASAAPRPARPLGATRIFFYVFLWGAAMLFLMAAASIFGIVHPRANLFATEEKTQSKHSSGGLPAPHVGSLMSRTGNATLAIRSLGVASPIISPSSTDQKVLKRALDQGVVHYPLSARPDAPYGNVFLFGHSSGRAFEENPARTVFTRLNQLKPGDTVEITYGNAVYLYRVNLVRISPSEEAIVYLTSPNRILTLSTCWPVGDPENRFIVQAEFVRQIPLSGNQALGL